MTRAIPTRFSDRELAMIDALVAAGLGRNRSEVIRRAVAHLSDAERRRDIGVAIVASYRNQPQTPDDDAAAMANAMAMTESELW